MPIQFKEFGGVYFQDDGKSMNQFVKSMSIEKQNGKTYYVVKFKTGAEIKYPKQKNKGLPPEKGPSIAFWHNANYGHNSYTIERISGAIFNGTSKSEDISIYGCKDTKINVRGGGEIDFVRTEKNSSNTRVIADHEDIVYKPNPKKHEPDVYTAPGNIDVVF